MGGMAIIGFEGKVERKHPFIEYIVGSFMTRFRRRWHLWWVVNTILEVHRNLTIAVYSVIVPTEQLSTGQGLVFGSWKCVIEYKKQHF